MNVEETKKLVERLYREAWGQGHIDVVDEVFAPHHVIHWNEQCPTIQKRTTSELKEIIVAYREAFPDLQVTINELVAEGNKVAVQVTFEGTHKGTYEGFAPTNKRSRFTDMQIVSFSGGRIQESTLGSGGLKYFFGVLDGSVLE